MRNILFGLSASLCLICGPAAAQPIPGANDPALKEAALDWLTGENPREDLWRLGEIAADGNVAARIFVDRIYRSHIPLDFPGLTWQARRALLPPDPRGTDSHFSPYSVRPDYFPIFGLHAQMSQAESTEEWADWAERLIDAGLYRKFADSVTITLQNRKPDLSIEIVKYIEDNITMDIEVQAAIWLSRYIENANVDMAFASADDEEINVAEQRMARWGGAPWRPEDAQEFDAALRDGRWDAISLIQPFRQLQPDAASRLEYAAEYDWILDIQKKAHARRRDNAPTSVELERLGRLLIADAAQTPYLQPLVTSCDRYCPDMAAECVARGELLKLVNWRGYVSLEPIITDAEYHRSRRAADDLMRLIALRYAKNQDRGMNIDLPQCLADASAAFAR